MALPERATPVVFPILKSLGYCAVGVGRPETYALDRYVDAAKSAGIPVVQVGAADKPGVVPYTMKEVGGVKVAILSFGAVQDTDAGFELQKRRYAAYKEAREKSEILVLMDQGNVVNDEWLQRMTARWGAPDMIISGNYAAQVFGNPKVVGKTYVLPNLQFQAKYIGVASVRLEKGKDPQMNYSQSYLDDNVKEDPDVKKVIDAYNAEERARIQSISNAVDQNRPPANPAGQAIPAATPPQPQPQTVVQPGSSGTLMSGVYYDSKDCVSCHKAEYDSWATTKHASAVKTLIDKGRDIPACLECHSERYRQTSAYLPGGDTSKIGVECASCHSRVLPHGADGPSKEITGAKIDLDTCRVCHTKDQSPKFESDSKQYWEKASHKPAKT